MRRVRLLAFFTLLSVLSPTTAVRADDPFEACVITTGRPYVTARDAWLAATASDDLAGHLEANDWRKRLTAKILAGWQGHTAAYRAHTAPAARRDQIDRADTVLLSRPGRVPAETSPLLYEFLFKDTVPKTTMAAAAHVLVYQHRHGQPVDVTLLREAFLDPAYTRTYARNLLAGMFAQLPIEDVGVEDLLPLLRSEVEREAPHFATTLALLDGIVAKSQAAPLSRRDTLSDVLIRLSSLRETVGALRLAYAIGDLHGTRGVSVAAEMLQTTAVPGQQRWALDTLGRAGTEEAARSLLAFAQSGTRPPYLRRLALRNLERCRQDTGTQAAAADLASRIP